MVALKGIMLTIAFQYLTNKTWLWGQYGSLRTVLLVILYRIYGLKNSYCLITSTDNFINQQMLNLKKQYINLYWPIYRNNWKQSCTPLVNTLFNPGFHSDLMTGWRHIEIRTIYTNEVYCFSYIGRLLYHTSCEYSDSFLICKK